MDKQQIIQLIWDEWHSGKAGLNSPSRASQLRSSGHAQCALNLLGLLGEDTTEANEFMADYFNKVVRDGK